MPTIAEILGVKTPTTWTSPADSKEYLVVMLTNAVLGLDYAGKEHPALACIDDGMDFIAVSGTSMYSLKDLENKHYLPKDPYKLLIFHADEYPPLWQTGPAAPPRGSIFFSDDKKTIQRSDFVYGRPRCDLKKSEKTASKCLEFGTHLKRCLHA